MQLTSPFLALSILVALTASTTGTIPSAVCQLCATTQTSYTKACPTPTFATLSTCINGQLTCGIANVICKNLASGGGVRGQLRKSEGGEINLARGWMMIGKLFIAQYERNSERKRTS